jgi:hypothetical protein
MNRNQLSAEMLFRLSDTNKDKGVIIASSFLLSRGIHVAFYQSILFHAHQSNKSTLGNANYSGLDGCSDVVEAVLERTYLSTVKAVSLDHFNNTPIAPGPWESICEYHSVLSL